MMKNLIITATLLATLAACEPTSGPNVVTDPPVDVAEWSVIVTVVDQLGQPFSPDDAYWELPYGFDDTFTQYALECLNDDCTQFGVSLDTTGEFWVAATYERSITETDLCWYQGYDASPVFVEHPTDMSQWAAVEITLQLDTDQQVCI
jgi:hypothetical protein